MIKKLKAAYKAMTTPVTLREIVSAELVEEQRKLLAAEAGYEYAGSEVERRKANIERLKARLVPGQLIERGEEVPAPVTGRASRVKMVGGAAA